MNFNNENYKIQSFYYIKMLCYLKFIEHFKLKFCCKYYNTQEKL